MDIEACAQVITLRRIVREYQSEISLLKQEIDKLAGIIKTHDLCHNLHGKVDARSFCDGCTEEQRKLYGCAPDADLLQEAKKIIGLFLRARILKETREAETLAYDFLRRADANANLSPVSELP